MFFKKIVSCEVCRCLVEKEDAQEIQYVNLRTSLYGRGISYKYYCQADKRPYDRVTDYWRYGNRIYHAEVSVSEDGTPVGYVKAPAEKPKKSYDKIDKIKQ